MGIKGLMSYLKLKAPNAMQGQPVQKLDVLTPVAVDTPLFIHKFFFTMGSAGLGYAFGQMRWHLENLNMKPIWVFDGQKIQLKQEERERRSQYGRDKPQTRDFDFIKEILGKDNIRMAKYEAEALCSYMVFTGECYAAVTDDSDAIAYLCPRIIQHASLNMQRAKIVSIGDIMEEGKLTANLLQEMCVYSGNDFIHNIEKVGPATALKELRGGKTSFGDPEYESRANDVRGIFRSFCFELQ
jgi:5'-3' exonuclease